MKKSLEPFVVFQLNSEVNLTHFFKIWAVLAAKRLTTRDAGIILCGNRLHLSALFAVFQLFLIIVLITTLISLTKMKFAERE